MLRNVKKSQFTSSQMFIVTQKEVKVWENFLVAQNTFLLFVLYVQDTKILNIWTVNIII